MSKYILILIWIGFMALLANQGNFQRVELVCGKPEKRYVPWFAALVFAPVVWMSATRGWMADTGAYLTIYAYMPESLSGIPAYIAGQTKDIGFYLVSAIIRAFVGYQEVVYLLIFALIQGICLVGVYRKYSSSYILSIFLFVISTDYISWMMNGLRQFVAVTIIFAATTFMLNKKYVPLICVILLAATMHQSALIMIPLVFIAQGKAWNKKTLACMVLAILAIVFVGQFTGFLESGLADTQYKNVMNDAKMFEDDGTNPIRVLVYAVPTLIAFFGRKIIALENDPLVDFCVNMSVLATGLYLVSMVTSGVFLGRLPIYVSLYNYILLPWEIDHLFTKASKKIVYVALIMFYALFYYYQLHFGWGLL